MFNTTNTTNQSTPTPIPEQPQQKFQFVPRRKRFSFSKIPIVAQVSGVLSLLLLGAGLLTVNQLSQTSQDLQSQAAAGDVLLEFDQKTAELAYLQEKSFFIVATPSNTNMKISAAIIRIKNEKTNLVEVTSITPVANVLPVVLKPFTPEIASTPTSPLAQHAITLGAEPTKPVSGVKNLVEVKVKAKSAAGRAVLEIAQNSEIAAFENAGNVMKVYDLANAQKQFLTIDVKAPAPGGGTSDNVCSAITASLVTVENGVTKLSALPANSQVKRGDTIEYSFTIKPPAGATQLTFNDQLPNHVEYVRNSTKIDGLAPGTTAPYSTTEHRIQFTVAQPTGNTNPRTVVYRVKVKADAPDTGTAATFKNLAQITFNTGTQAGTNNTCSIVLAVGSTITPPTSPPASANPKLSVKFQIQGVIVPNVPETGEIALRYPNQQNSSQKVVKKYQASFMSGANGVFTSNMVELTDLPPTIAGEIEVFVKTPTTLRKKLGSIAFNAFNPTTREFTYDKSSEVLFVGDFYRVNDENAINENLFNMLDVSRMLSQYVRATNPVNENNKQYDLDKNGVINIIDVSIILSNYVTATRRGEEI